MPYAARPLIRHDADWPQESDCCRMRSLRRAGFAVRALPTLLCVGALAMFVVAPALHARQAAEQTDAAASPAVEPSAADAVESAVALVDADRPAALGRLRAIWEDPDHPLRGRAAVALTGVMVDGPDNESSPTG